ncbi:MAG: peptide chain release factor 1 [Myxococcales bacterium]|nr:MAG: peptide chain release factor 1 [Myxococcales bacterium]
MLEKLEEIETKYAALEAQLTDSKVISDRALFQKVSKEHADLSELVDAYRQFKRVVAQIADVEDLLREGDSEMKEMARQEFETLRHQRDDLEEQLKHLLLPKDPNDAKNVILEIRAGTGGEEATLFAGDLYRMYSRYAENKGWKIELLSASESDLGGFKEIIVLVTGKDVYSHLKYESGVHRVQRVPVTEAQGRIHTSAATVAVLIEAEETDLEVRQEDLRIDVYRSSGAGGQHVNTTDSAVRLTHVPTGMVVVCQDERSQIKNRSKAMKILRSRLAEMERERLDKEQADTRRGQVGTGDRSERIRTYNFPQSRLTDHRINYTVYRLPAIMEGDLDELIVQTRSFFQAEALKGNAA